MLRGLPSTLLLLVAVALPACNGPKDCTEGESRCVDGTHVERCIVEHDPEIPEHWEKADCFGETPVCTTSTISGMGYCATHANLEPGCPQEVGGSEVCDGLRALQCVDGVSIREALCDAACFISSNTSAYCSLLPAMDPLCAGIPARTNCDVMTRIECLDGWRIGAGECTGAGGCQVFTAGTFGGQPAERAACVLDAERDPACARGTEDGYCDGDHGVMCFDGWVVGKLTCAPLDPGSGVSASCFDHGKWIECLTDVVSQEGDEYGLPPGT